MFAGCSLDVRWMFGRMFGRMFDGCSLDVRWMFGLDVRWMFGVNVLSDPTEYPRRTSSEHPDRTSANYQNSMEECTGSEIEVKGFLQKSFFPESGRRRRRKRSCLKKASDARASRIAPARASLQREKSIVQANSNQDPPCHMSTCSNQFFEADSGQVRSQSSALTNSSS